MQMYGMGVNGEDLQLDAVYIFNTSRARIHIRYYKSCAASERAMKLKVRMIKSSVKSHTGKNITRSFAVGIVTHAAHL